MRIIAAFALAVTGLLFSYWALVQGTHDPIEWVFVSAFVWLMCHDLWHRFFNRSPQTGRPTWRAEAPLRRPSPRS